MKILHIITGFVKIKSCNYYLFVIQYVMKRKRMEYNSVLEQISHEYEQYGRFKTHIPSHHVYYVRAALRERTGQDFSVEDVEKALVAEGKLRYGRVT